MTEEVKPPVSDRDEYYETATRAIRWIVLGLVLVSFPFEAANAIAVLTLVGITGLYNALRYSPKLRQTDFFGSILSSLAVDHVFVIGLVVLTGGLASPYYPLIFLLIIGAIASYGIAGFAFVLGTQALVTVALYAFKGTAPALSNEYQLVIKFATMVIFALVAEQTVRNRDEEYLLEGLFTRRTETERQRLLSLINSISDAVLAIDSTGKVYLYNAAALALLNTNRSITGMDIDDLLPLHEKTGRKVSLHRLITKQERTFARQDLDYDAADGSKMILDLTVTPVHALTHYKENAGGYMVLFRDITKEKTLDEERDEFVSVTSHELRTPLAIAEANLSTALLPGYAKIDPKAKQMVEQAHKNIIFLSELIEDLATLSRAERGDLKLKHEIVEVQALAEELAVDYRPQAEAKGLALNLELAPDLGSIVTSRMELREILQNFLTNSIKYTATGSVTLAVSTTDDGTDFVVRDTGIGISASDKPKLFGKFYRSEDYRTRATGGTGLGLYITHKLAEKLGVTITFTSKLNHGSAFRVHVPIKTGDEAAAAVAKAAAAKAA